MPEGLPEREIEAGGGFPFLENLGVEREGERREVIDAALAAHIQLPKFDAKEQVVESKLAAMGC